MTINCIVILFYIRFAWDKYEYLFVRQNSSSNRLNHSIADKDLILTLEDYDTHLGVDRHVTLWQLIRGCIEIRKNTKHRSPNFWNISSLDSSFPRKYDATQQGHKTMDRYVRNMYSI